ncbi:MAG: tetratricopeptide repeat protein [Phycisphaerales bacterium]|nr:tetratricopeptide repeat protein [Phycisphaerales bacterium]
MTTRAPSHSRSRLSQLWQLPLLLISLGLFGYAAYLFIDPRPGLTLQQKLEFADALIEQERPEAALEFLNKLLSDEKLEPQNEAQVHLLLASGLAKAQHQRRISIPVNHQRIIEQLRLALQMGISPNAAIHKQLAESYEALSQPEEALANYRRAMTLDPDLGLPIRKKIITLQLGQDELGAAEASLQQYVQQPQISDSEKAWALGEQAMLLIDRGAIAPARTLLDQALALELDPVAQGEINYRIGYAAWKLNQPQEAERYLRVARDQLKVRHPLDADACWLLGRIHQDRGDARGAISFYQTVLASHIDSPLALLARVGRGTTRILDGQDEAGLADLQDSMRELMSKASRAKYKPQAVAEMKKSAAVLTHHENYSGALEVLGWEQELLDGQPPAEFFARLALVYERKADQMESSLADLKQAERLKRQQQVRDLRIKNGDALVAYSRLLTVDNDGAYGDALWKGIDLYDRAGDIQRVVSALELFVAERPDDRLAPDALLRLGKACQAAGMIDKAIDAYQRNLFRYPKSIAAAKSAVPLAQAYIARGPIAYAKAESVLRSVIENNPLVTPEAEEFKQALFELGQLYYRTSRYEEAIARLEEWTQRYPQDERLGQMLFLMADSYRKSAELLTVQLASTNPGDAVIDASEATAARRQRLSKARGLYDQVVDCFRSQPPTRELDKVYMRLSHFYRADCQYDLGDYEDAIKLYDVAAFRYQDDPSALAAYVQIVNANCALGRMAEAKTANERAKWLLRRMPKEAFEDGSFSMPRQYWQQWLKWTNDSGLW